MQNDLISRQAVIDVLKETGIIVDNDLGNLVVAEIERIPTAYDVEKVMAEMDKKSSRAIETLGEQKGLWFIKTMELAKKIVRNGGKE